MVISVKEAYKLCVDALGKTDGRFLFEGITKKTMSDVLTHPDEKVDFDFETAIGRIKDGEPVQYVTGETEFMGLTFKVTSDVLIPRQDTETLVELVLADHKEKDIKLLDMCTGSGCIAISLAVHGGYAHVEAADISTEALKVAEKNGKSLLSEREIRFRHSDLFSAFDQSADKFDIIVSNPPYIPSDVIEELEPEVRDFEPRSALDGTADGLFFYEKLAEECGRFLRENGSVYFEIGHDQGEAVEDLLRTHGFKDTKTIKDLAGNDRVVCGRWQSV